MDNNVPEIRFKGFSKAWIVSDLKSLCDSFSYGLNASAVKFDGVNKYIRITDINEKSRRFDYCQLTSPDADLSKSDNYLLKNGDILFARTGASVGKTYIYNEQDGKVYFAGFLIRASINNKASAQFIFQNTQTHEYARFVATSSQRSGQPGINAKEYSEYRLFSPTEPEQTQIGNYFQKLDELINQHQQKHEKLSNIKKSMLEKMFPKPGETIPEIRFKGFSGDWGYLALGENAKFTKGQGYSKSDLVTSGSPIILYGRIYTKYQTVITNVDTFVTEKIKSVKSIGGEVIVPASGESPEDISRASVVSEPNVIIGGDLNIILPGKNIHATFLALAISNGHLKKKLSSKAQGKSVVHIRNSDLADLDLILPTEYMEQTAISNYFQKLDTLINQHQQQITKLNNIKQACLRKMFV